MSPEKEVVYSCAAELIIFLEKLFAEYFDEFERRFNRLISQRKTYFRRIVSRLYHKKRFDENVYKLIRDCSKREAEVFHQWLKYYRYTVYTTSEKIANAMIRCDSVFDADIIGKNIAKCRFNRMQKIIYGKLQTIKQERKKLRRKLRIINGQNNEKPVTKPSTKTNRCQPKVNKKEYIYFFVIRSSKNMNEAANFIINNLRITTNRTLISIIDNLNWKSFKKKIFLNFSPSVSNGMIVDPLHG